MVQKFEVYNLRKSLCFYSFGNEKSILNQLKFTKHTFRFKRGGRGFKGGPDRIGLGFEEGNSKTNTSSSDPLPEYLTSNSSVKTRTDVSGKYNCGDYS